MKIDCTHATPHQHGTTTAYKRDKCRCQPCRAANSAAETRRTRLKAYGMPTHTLVDAAPVRAHVHALQATGLGWKTIAARAGVPVSTMGNLLYGRPRADRPRGLPAARVQTAFASRVLAVPLPDASDIVAVLAGAALADGSGTRRRLQALVAIGWSQSYLAQRLGMLPTNIHRVLRCAQVLASTARAAADLYDELWDRPAPDGKGRNAALKIAAREGWLPPLAWDDDTIDDPTAQPATPAGDDAIDEVAVETALSGRAVHLTTAELEVAASRLLARGHVRSDIATRLHLDPDDADRVIERLKRRALRARTATQTTAA